MGPGMRNGVEIMDDDRHAMEMLVDAVLRAEYVLRQAYLTQTAPQAKDALARLLEAIDDFKVAS